MVAFVTMVTIHQETTSKRKPRSRLWSMMHSMAIVNAAFPRKVIFPWVAGLSYQQGARGIFKGSGRSIFSVLTQSMQEHSADAQFAASHKLNRFSEMMSASQGKLKRLIQFQNSSMEVTDEISELVRWQQAQSENPIGRIFFILFFLRRVPEL
jgi:hypothetical protein